MKKRRETSKRNMLDLFLILLLAVSLVSGGARFYGVHAVAVSETQQRFLVDLQSAGTNPRVAECFETGEILYLSNGEEFGRVASIRVLPLSETVFEEGSAYEGEWDITLRCRVLLTVECMGITRNEVFLAGGKVPICIGESLVLIGNRSEIAWQIFYIREEVK